MTNRQLINVVAFIAFMENNGGLLGDKDHAGKSPGYIEEKFQRYALEDMEEAWRFGLDKKRMDLVAAWTKKWLLDETGQLKKRT